MSNLDDIDPTFVDDLESSQEAVRLVGQYLAALGRMIIIPPTFTRPDPSQSGAYADAGDLWVGQLWEVKHRQLDFTGRADYPHPDTIVDVVQAHEKKRPTPAYYMIVNRAMTRGLVIDVRATKAKWVPRQTFCRGRTRELYYCPLELLHEVTLRV